MFLEIQQIKKHFGEGESRVDVLRGIDINIEKGEICVLLGPSGSGKSTLLNIIGGIETPDSSSGRRSAEPLSRIRTFCCATSRPVHWTTTLPRRS